VSACIRLALASYACLLRLTPRSYRADFGNESMSDLREILLEAERFAGQTVVGTALRAHLDLMYQLPGTWWAELRPEPAGSGRGAGAPPGIRERTMNFMNELRLAARSLAKRPGFTLVAVLTLALGIGANVAIFSIVNAVLLRPLPFEDSDRLVQIRHHAPGLDLPELENSEALLGYYQRRAPFLEGVAGWGRGSSNLAGADQAIRVNVVAGQPALFELLRTQPFMGRPFNADDVTPDQEDGSDVVALSWNTWRSDFGADPSVLGRVIELDGRSVEVVAVMPEGFGFPDEDVDLYRALYLDPDGDFGTFGIRGLARLAPDVSVAAAQLRIDEMVAGIPDRFERITTEFLETAGFSASVETLRDSLVVDVESALWIILGTVAFVLLIACANVANLFLVRAESRQKEMAVRAAMGAGRRAVATTFLSESLLLGIGGGVVGVLIAGAGMDALLRIADLPRASEISLDAASLAVAGILSVVAGLAFGALPMARYAGTRFAAVLRDNGREVDEDAIATMTAEKTEKVQAAFGGSILNIEAIRMPGRGRIEVTGQLGDVMRESAQAALSFVRANCAEFDVDPKLFRRSDIHLHFPEGATPKDGPSAGVAIATCLVSLFTGRPVRHDLAMTGEVTLKGKVLEVGGVKEKLLAAQRAGIRTVLVPKDNLKDLEDVPEEVRRALDVIGCEEVETNICEALLDTVVANDLDDVEQAAPARAARGGERARARE